MPKQTFLNLSEDKKQKIIEAARKEFSRVPFYEASISNIIKGADIPRGSFYQYFENKEDIFLLVLKEYKNINENKFKNLLMETDGDLVEAFMLLFEYLLQSFKDEENKKLFKNIFLNMNHKMEENIAPELKEEHKDKKYKEMIELIDLQKLNIKDTDDIRNVFRVLMTLTMTNIVQSFAKQLSFEKSLEMYKKQVDLVKVGIYKNEKK